MSPILEVNFRGAGRAKSADSKTTRLGNASIYLGDATEAYEGWLPPAVIIADGP